jgi:predicted glycosyltransferase
VSGPRLLLWCQHSLGLGHLARSLLLIEALVRDFQVTLLNGGRMPPGVHVPDGAQVINLPPLGLGAHSGLMSHDPSMSVEQATARRTEMILAAYARVRPDVVVLELYPFGRKAFEPELLPLLELVHSQGANRPHVVCSLRDILISGRADQHRHDERVVRRANSVLDAIMVHADPAFARLEESFQPVTPLTVRVHYTGFVAPVPPVRPFPITSGGNRRLIVSSGGGMVGAPLVKAAVSAHRRLHAATGLTTTIVAGPFLPAPDWRWLRDQASRSLLLTAVRQVPDLAHEIGLSRVSLSQAGYNTTMDLLRAGTPAVVVPYGEGQEDEQRRRSLRLQDLGLLRVLAPEELTADRLIDEITVALQSTVLQSTPPEASLNLDGAAVTAQLLVDLLPQPIRSHSSGVLL